MEQQQRTPVNRILDEPTGEVEQALVRARRTAFVARFIVLRESKRTRAHRVIETMEWADQTTAGGIV